MSQIVNSDVPPSPRRNDLALYPTVMITGAAVMILELLGTRIIAPFYGVSLYVWSSLIAVTLIALALGYFIGGMFADRHPTIRLTHVILASAVATVAIPFLSGSILRLTDSFGLRAGAFTSTLLLFMPSLTLLAMVGPYVIKRATRDLGGVGAASGTVYAISTLGSVMGTLLLGFFLLPMFGTRAIIFSLSLLLATLAVFVAIFERNSAPSHRSLRPIVATTAVICIVTALNFLPIPHQAPGFTVQSQSESLYGWVRVVDDDRRGFRLLLSDASVISAVDLKQNRSLLGYQEILGLLPTLHPAAANALLIGLGGGHVARDLTAQGVMTDTIEIDPAVADAARRFFHFEPTGLFLVGDARYEIHRLEVKYDLIIHDCFTGGAEPTHLLTVEMLGELRDLLRERGILALNYVGFRTGEGSDAVAAVHRTLRNLFPHLRVFVTDKADFTDFIFLASRHPLHIESKGDDRRVGWLLDHEHRFEANRDDFLITDEYNPMESRQIRKAETYRERFLERISFELLLR